MDDIGEKDCNSKELARLLVGSIQRLLNLKQWTGYTRLQAIDDPFRFIEEVAKHADTLEKEDESKGSYHLRISGITPEGAMNKINCIKGLRQLMGWGLADTKYSWEALPGSGHAFATSQFTIITHPFTTQESLTDSKEWKDFFGNRHLFVYDTPQLLHAEASKPYKPDPRY